jgi:hypothetical protein
MLALLAKYKLMVVAAALLGALGMGGVGVAAAHGALPLSLNAALGQSSPHVGQTQPGAAAHGKRGPHGGIVHGSVITNVNGAYVTYTLDVGQVTSASASAITLKRADGQSVTLTITANTAWANHHAAPKDFSKLQGRNLVIFSQNGAAVQIGRGNDVLKNATHLDVTVTRNGKTREIQIDRGSVLSASATQISVKRADGVTVAEPVAAKARWVQAPHHTAIQPDHVAVGAQVAIVTYQGQVVAVRLPAASPAASSSAS